MSSLQLAVPERHLTGIACVRVRRASISRSRRRRHSAGRYGCHNEVSEIVLEVVEQCSLFTVCLIEGGLLCKIDKTSGRVQIVISKTLDVEKGNNYRKMNADIEISLLMYRQSGTEPTVIVTPNFRNG